MACFAHIFAVSLLVSFANAICYAWLDGAAYSRDSGYYIACGVSDSNGVQSCCDKGDTCLGDSLCRSADPNPSVSGYYIAGCTDATYSNSLCSKHCSNYTEADVVYSSGVWACCDAGSGSDCSNPSSETFSGPSPAQLDGSSPSGGISSSPPSATSASATPSAVATSSRTPASSEPPPPEVSSKTPLAILSSSSILHPVTSSTPSPTSSSVPLKPSPVEAQSAISSGSPPSTSKSSSAALTKIVVLDLTTLRTSVSQRLGTPTSVPFTPLALATSASSSSIIPQISTNPAYVGEQSRTTSSTKTKLKVGFGVTLCILSITALLSYLLRKYLKRREKPSSIRERRITHLGILPPAKVAVIERDCEYRRRLLDSQSPRAFTA